MERKQIEQSLREIIAKHVDPVDVQNIESDTELDSLGVDSLALNLILIDMEETFDFTMSGADMIKLITLAKAVEYVEQRLGN